MADSVKEMRDFFNILEQESGNFENELKTWLRAWCEEFLDNVVEEIKRRNVIDSGILRDSFIKGDKLNVWLERDSGLTIEVGSEAEYAAAVNNGHKTCPEGVAERWVPGYWLGKRFVYDRFSKTGMLLRQQWIDARPFFTDVERYASEDFAEYMSNKLNERLEHIWSI